MTAIESVRPINEGVGRGETFIAAFTDLALAPVSIRPLVVVRIAFGLMMAVSMIRFMAMGWIRELYVLPQFHFTYAGFGWIRPLPEAGLWLVFIILTLLSLAVALGFAYRFSIISFFILFTYIELLDKTYYLNHYYFVSLIAFLFIFLPLNAAFSVDTRLGIVPRRTAVPAWMVWLVRLQLALVYCFAGLAKINPDWLFEALPLRIWLRARTGTPLIGGLFDAAWVAYAMSWGGLLFDLTISFWLSWRKSRLVAYTAVIVFHGLTGLLFRIGMFPWIMMACTLVFFEWPFRGGAEKKTNRQLAKKGWPVKLTAAILLLFFLIQLGLPLRHWLIPGDVNWTEQGARYSWRVMLVEKTGQATFFVRGEQSGQEWLVFPSDYLTDLQEKQMSFQPDMITEFAHFIASQYEEPVSVRAEVYVSWNGRSSRLLLDPAVDLVQHQPVILD